VANKITLKRDSDDTNEHWKKYKSSKNQCESQSDFRLLTYTCFPNFHNFVKIITKKSCLLKKLLKNKQVLQKLGFASAFFVQQFPANHLSITTQHHSSQHVSKSIFALHRHITLSYSPCSAIFLSCG